MEEVILTRKRRLQRPRVKMPTSRWNKFEEFDVFKDWVGG